MHMCVRACMWVRVFVCVTFCSKVKLKTIKNIFLPITSNYVFLQILKNHLFNIKGEWRGLAVSIEDCHPKVGGSSPRRSSFSHRKGCFPMSRWLPGKRIKRDRIPTPRASTKARRREGRWSERNSKVERSLHK